MGIQIEAAAYNIIGRRKNNEDNFYLNGVYLSREQMDQGGKKAINCSNPTQVYAVFDGMGGGEYGEFASHYASTKLKEYQKNCDHLDNGENLRAFLNDVSEGIDAEAVKNGLRSGACGSTAAMLIIGDWWYRTAHVGDSRVYLLREGQLRRITKDQSEVQRMVDMGRITLDEAWAHPRKNVITHHLGMPLHGRMLNCVISGRMPLVKGDRFLICSDGVNDSLRDNEILEILKDEEPLVKVASHMVHGAKKRADEMGVEADNTTAIVVKVCEVGASDSAEKRVKRLERGRLFSAIGAALFALCFAASCAMIVLKYII